LFNKLIIFVILNLVCFGSLYSQSCTTVIKGVVIDLHTNKPLESVSIFNIETEKSSFTDSLGQFEFRDFCTGNYHFLIRHLACESKELYLALTKDTSIIFTLEHSINLLGTVYVDGRAIEKTIKNVQTVKQSTIQDYSNESLSNILEQLPGVNTIKNGSGISKPIVNGLYGNRLLILNNGVPQSGQQWGSDHSPEIDPLVANTIKVVKGAGALEYMGANLGNVILIEPAKIRADPHLHGRTTFSYGSNGRASSLNLQLEQGGTFAWKINGTLKKSGDRSSPSYFLRNTGSDEANLALQVERNFNNKLFTEIYLSTFNTTLGVLRGSHVGNLTDLTEALSRQVPFFTEDSYSKTIDAPKQRVNHHLAKFRIKYFRSKSDWFDFTVAGQKNVRKEFDIRRGLRSEIPALSLYQYSFLSELKYQIEFEPQLTLKTGFQTNFTDNSNDSETGILPLIPDYRSVELGQYAILSKKYKSQTWELGIRNSYFVQNVATITRTIPKTIERFDNKFYNLNATAGWSYDYQNKLVTTLSTGYIKRNPAINELYSLGLHQGVSGIEEGTVDLNPEKSWKNTMAVKAIISKNITIESFAYYQRIADYIFLAPQNELQLTIRGAFPLFKYDQTDGRMYGVDAQTIVDIKERLSVKLAYSYLHGRDLSNNVPLIGMPSNNTSTSFDYIISKDFKWLGVRFDNLDVGVNHRYVFRQSNLLPFQDFTLPPPSYQLSSLKASTNLTYKTQKIRLLFRIENLFNVRFRDYLNRQRYFSDDLGRNIVMVFQSKF